ncbi:hypothetical protein ABI_10690 [Asticcacaulis biprosthecium C19]|uniref:Uncharacterized protein n=1 Tax=Asticcacaulis biprosthecium C19 TaxID=715226 RepID=F4QH95_9CAUL|nr:hypothetical protein [Asticcacaulis biprosthecium]EGF92632.1 hypothetical protein ABI_10690 [Asticcacaulis biprosthecium C19]
MSVRKLILTIAMLTPLTACQPSHVKAGDLKPMSDAEVRKSLSNVMIGPECCDSSEGYYRNGVHMIYGEGIEEGHYTVQGNRVCTRWVYPGKPDLCREFYRDSWGRVYYSEDGQGAAIRFESRPSGEVESSASGN